MSNLQDKTIRPGSLKGYAYYYSNRHPVSATVAAKPPRAHGRRGLLLLVLVIVLAGLAYKVSADHGSKPVANKQPAAQSAPAPSANVTAPPPVNHCAGNALDKFIKISVDQRHLWACEGVNLVYDAPVITGLRGHPETETPLGTYHISGKTTNTTLTGSDSRGSWKDPVYYWMPFLTNQYGTYGFHDATWRAADAFGNVSPDSQDASHGCVELPLAASKWLYNWAPVRTTVTVEA